MAWYWVRTCFYEPHSFRSTKTRPDRKSTVETASKTLSIPTFMIKVKLHWEISAARRSGATTAGTRTWPQAQQVQKASWFSAKVEVRDLRETVPKKINWAQSMKSETPNTPSNKWGSKASARKERCGRQQSKKKQLYYMLLVRRFYPKRLTYSILWTIPTGAIWGEVSCPGTQRHADCSGVWTCDPLIPTPRLYPLRHTPPSYMKDGTGKRIKTCADSLAKKITPKGPGSLLIVDENKIQKDTKERTEADGRKNGVMKRWWMR